MKKNWLIFIALTICFSIVYPQTNRAGSSSPAVCYNWENIAAAEAAQLDSTAMALISAIVDIQPEKLWRDCDPVFQTDISQDKFTDFTLTLAERIVSLQHIRRTDGKIVETQSKLTAPVSIACGSNKSGRDDYFEIRLWPEIQKTAVIFYELNSEQIVRNVVLVMAKRKNSPYRLLSLYVTPATYFGKNAEYFENLAQTAVAAGNQTSGYWFYHCALLLSQTGPVIRSNQSIRLQQATAALQEKPRFQESISQLNLNGVRYPIFTFYFIELENRLVPLVAYLSRYDGTAKDTDTTSKIEAEAKQICQSLQKSNSDFFDEFPSVMFQAYFEPPADPTKQYPYYKIMVDANEFN